MTFIRNMLVVLLAMTFAPAEAGIRDKAVFDITANGFRFGDMQLDYTEDAAEYRFKVSASAKGIFGFLTQSRYEGSANGVLRDAQTRQPVFFTARSTRIFKDRQTTINFENGKPVTVNLTPEKDRTDFTDPVSVKDQRLDSLTYLTLLFHNPGSGCPPDGKLYDGRRLTEAQFQVQDKQDGLLHCTGTYRITNGPDHSVQSGRREFGISLDYSKTDQGLSLTSAEFTSGGNTLLLTRQDP